ncbi:MAG TPA: DUF4352 domain-containing protein [Actinobacteria bacterium]|nr:DUF4352 domain-containing protein [Actinomycetota bacterium]
MTKRFRKSKKTLVGLSVVVLVLVLGSCRSPATTENPASKQKRATARNAKQVANKFWNLMNKGEFSEAYRLIDPKSREILNKKDFIKASNANESKPKVRVGSVIVNGNDANVALLFEGKSGQPNVSSKIVYADKKWFQKLETDLLISYGFHPKDIPFLTNVAQGKKFSSQWFSGSVTQVSRDKTMTDTSGEQATAEGVFITVTLDLTNNGNFPFTFDANKYLTLFDGQALFFSPSSRGDSFAEIDSGAESTFKAVFNVPENSRDFYLLIGDEDDRILVPLVL